MPWTEIRCYQNIMELCIQALVAFRFKSNKFLFKLDELKIKFIIFKSDNHFKQLIISRANFISTNKN